MPQTNHTRFIVSCVTLLGVLCVASGATLTFKGYNAELLIGGAVSAISGLLGMLSTRQNQPAPDITMTAGPPSKVEVTQPKVEPQPEPTP